MPRPPFETAERRAAIVFTDWCQWESTGENFSESALAGCFRFLVEFFAQRELCDLATLNTTAKPHMPVLFLEDLAR
jgi:hypothetical protein